MKRFRSALVCLVFAAILVQVCLIHVHAQTIAARPRRIAVFGSSVAFGTGDETMKEGYTGLLRELLAPRGWEVFNQSKGGDTTASMAPRFTPVGEPQAGVRYLTTVNPGYVVIALSLTNEGILEARTTEAKEAVFKQYADGIQGFVNRARQNNITPIVALVYPRMSYTPVEYEYIRRMNLLINTWDVPSVNLLGALDDGAGRYVKEFDTDDRHPDAAGHRELFYTFVPSLFEALEKGKPIPSKTAAAGFARIAKNGFFVFEPQDTMHSFAVSFSVRAQGNGTFADIGGHVIGVAVNVPRTAGGGYRPAALSPGDGFGSSVITLNGRWTYRSANGMNYVSSVSADSAWHQIVISHYAARGETLFFVDGKLAGHAAERLEPNRFTIGGSVGGDYKDLLVYRSALNQDEVSALNSGKLLQASLEIYTPLTDARFVEGLAVENRAQSMSALKVGSGTVTHVTP
jgi:lysophospholipase L1-like esterase